MKYLSVILILLTISISCKKDDEQRFAEMVKVQKRNDSILQEISNNWKFDIPAPQPKVQQHIAGWNEWQQFSSEIEQKPTGTLTAYRQKAESLINKIAQVKITVPPFFNKPQVLSRISVLDTKAKSLYTYMALEVVQCEKITTIIKEITAETTSLQNQFDELIRISEVPKERGEAEMLRARDTTRMANPDNAPEPVNVTNLSIAPNTGVNTNNTENKDKNEKIIQVN